MKIYTIRFEKDASKKQRLDDVMLKTKNNDYNSVIVAVTNLRNHLIILDARLSLMTLIGF